VWDVWGLMREMRELWHVAGVEPRAVFQTARRYADKFQFGMLSGGVVVRLQRTPPPPATDGHAFGVKAALRDRLRV